MGELKVIPAGINQEGHTVGGEWTNPSIQDR